MPRQRIINPDFWLDEQIAVCGFEVRLFYIGLWNFSDDYGVIEDSVMKMKAQVFPYDTVDVAPFRSKLVELGKLIPFEADGKKWFYIKNFLKYQRVEKPSKYRNPEPPIGVVGEHSTTPHQPLTSEEKRREVKRSEKKRREVASPDELWNQFLGNKLFEQITKEYPYRNYQFQFGLMCDWWMKNKKKLPQNISAFSNWLRNTREDDKEKAEKLRELAREDAAKKQAERDAIERASPEKLKEFQDRRNKLIGKL